MTRVGNHTLPQVLFNKLTDKIRIVRFVKDVRSLLKSVVSYVVLLRKFFIVLTCVMETTNSNVGNHTCSQAMLVQVSCYCKRVISKKKHIHYM